MLLKYDNVVYDMDDGDQINDLVDNILSNMSDSYIVSIWNECCNDQGCIEERIFSMDELEDYLELKGITAYDVIAGDVVNWDCFFYADDWFIVTIWGLRSNNSPRDLVDFSDDNFKAYFEELLLNKPEKYGCEEVDSEE